MFFREHHSSNLSFGWSGGGGATIVLEDLGADAPATVTRAEFGMCAWCAFAYQQYSSRGGSKPRSGQGRSSASQPSRLPGVCLACWATRALSRLSGLDTFQTPTALLVCLMRLIVVLMRLIIVLMRLKYQSNALRSRYFNRIKQTKGITLGTLTASKQQLIASNKQVKPWRRATPMPVRETPERVAATSSQPHAFRSAACARLRRGETAAHSSDSDGHPMANTKGHESSIR